ncbi:MAG: cation-transporting P-type ATPase [Dongiaceae bacterium]
MTDVINGLSSAEATTRLAAEGYNELPRAEQRTILRIVVEVVREPMFGLLIASGTIYLILGDLQEALFLLGFATLSIGIAVVQESRSENVLKALRALTSPRALVVRDGMRRRIPGREVVRGDVLVLSEGDRVPADGRLIIGDDLLVDESLLTGEESVRSESWPGHSDKPMRPGGDDLPCILRKPRESAPRSRSGRDQRHWPAQRDRQDQDNLERHQGERCASADHASAETRARRGAWWLGRPVSRLFCYAERCARTGSRRCSAASPSAWRCYRKSSRWC